MFEHPAWLWLLLLLPVLVAPGWLGRRGERRWAVALASILRAACFIAVAVALAGPLARVPVRARGLAVVAVMDQSRSIAPDQARWMQAQIARLRATASPLDQFSVIGFGRNAELLTPVNQPLASGVERGGTDIAGALSAAASLFPPTAAKKIVLLSDGNETQGSAADELPELLDQNIQVYTQAPPASHLQRIAIDSLVAPNPVRARLNFALQLAIDSDASTPIQANLNFAQEGARPVNLPLQLLPGLNHFELPVHEDKPGAHQIAVTLSAPQGTEVVNPRAELIASVMPAPHVLVASAQSPDSLIGALRLRDYQVDVTTPEKLPLHAEDYLRYQAVIIDDATAKSLTHAMQDALDHYVSDYGGGLIVTGSALRDQHFKGSELEALLPVKLVPQPPPPSRAPMGIYLVIDRSNSMSYNSRYPSIRDGERIRYAKEAAIALLNQLDDNDYVGVIAFDSQPYVIARLHPVGADRTQLIQKIMRLEPGGGTDFLEALQIAATDLIQSALPVRQIILLTDGDTNRQYHDHDQLMWDLAQEHLPVSTVRIGPDVENLRLLEDFAEMTGGTFYRVEDIEKLPQLFIRLSRQAVTVQHQTRMVPDRTSPILRGIPTDKIPAVDFFTTTEPKDDATVPLAIARGKETKPLIAAWQYGLGRAAVVAVDPDSLATVAWTQWDHYAQLWSQLVSWTMREGLSGVMNFKVTQHDSGTVTIEAEGRLPNNGGNLVCRIDGARGQKLTVPLTPVSNDIYRASGIALPPGKYKGTLLRKLGDQEQTLTSLAFGITPLRAPDQNELRLRPANLELLHRLAQRTGGAYAATPAQILRDGGRQVMITKPLAPDLIPLIMALFLGEVFVRRCLL